VPRDGQQIPLFRHRYGGSVYSFGFAIYSAASDRYEDAVLRTGLPVGTPQKALGTNAWQLSKSRSLGVLSVSVRSAAAHSDLLLHFAAVLR